MHHSSKYAIFAFIAVCMICLVGNMEVHAQSSFYNQRDDQYRLLGLKRAKEAYDVAKEEFERQKTLFDRTMISSRDLEQARNRLADAEVNYQQSLLAVLFEQQYITVTSAVKYQDKDGRKRVRLGLANASGGSAEYRKLINIDDELFNSLQPDIINNVYVSITNDAGAIISQPYEVKIDQLMYNRPQTLNFGLLEDLDAVTVNLIYGSGTQRSAKIFLQKDASVDRVIVQSQQFSQEAELGGTATYAMSLELFSGRTNTFKLDVVNLPQQINRYFVDPTSSARLSQFQFTESSNTRRANLQVFLPDRPSDQVPMDQPVDFFVVVIPQDRVAELGDIQQKTWTAEELDAKGIGYLKLELIPRGTGKLLVRARQLFQTAGLGDDVQFSVEMVNEGSRRLDNVEVDADVPLNWSKSFEPKVIDQLEIGAESQVELTFMPPPDVSPGKYEIRLRTKSVSNNQPVNGEDKTFTIEIQPRANIGLSVILFVLITALVVGIVYFGIRLTRR